MFYLGLLVLPCTHTEGPRSPRPVGLFILNHRVFGPFVGDCRPSFRTVVPRPSTHFGIFTLKGPLDVLDSYLTLCLSSLCLSIYHTLPSFGERGLIYSLYKCNREILTCFNSGDEHDTPKKLSLYTGDHLRSARFGRPSCHILRVYPALCVPLAWLSPSLIHGPLLASTVIVVSCSRP